jgi:hypothetical protein
MRKIKIMTSHYYRSPIVNFYELTDGQQKTVISDYCLEDYSKEDLDDMIFVFDSEDELNPIPLSMFMSTQTYGNKKPIFDGYFTTSNTSAYVIKIGRSNDVATVAAKYW